MIRYQDVSYSYRTSTGSVTALRRITFSVAEGERVVVLGPNGSGKSTLARMTNGLMLPDSGEVVVEGLGTSDSAEVARIRRMVGLVSQDPESSIVATSVEDDIAFGPENLGLPRDEIRIRVDAALEAMDLVEQAHREPHTLSGGQKQRLAIAGVIAMAPRYVVLDEPTSMLDPAGQAEVRRAISLLHRSGCGILHITHDLSDLVGATRAVVLSGGEVTFDGEPAALIADTARLESWGLEIPPILRLALELATEGVALPTDPTDPRALVEALCRS